MVNFQTFNTLRISVTMSVHFVDWFDSSDHSAHRFFAQIQTVTSVAVSF